MELTLTNLTSGCCNGKITFTSKYHSKLCLLQKKNYNFINSMSIFTFFLLKKCKLFFTIILYCNRRITLG